MGSATPARGLGVLIVLQHMNWIGLILRYLGILMAHLYLKSRMRFVSEKLTLEIISAFLFSAPAAKVITFEVGDWNWVACRMKHFSTFAFEQLLDAFWSHSSRTVASHVSEVRCMVKYSEVLDIAHQFPRLGPWVSS